MLLKIVLVPLICTFLCLFYHGFVETFRIAGPNYRFRRTLGISLLSLFRIVTLEDWTDIMYAAMEHHWWAWMYFVSFVVLGTFVVVNLFIAVVVNAMQSSYHEQEAEVADAAHREREEMLNELRRVELKQPSESEGLEWLPHGHGLP